MIGTVFTQSEPKQFRKNIASYFGNIFQDEKLGKNVEVGIYNYSIQGGERR